jgi:hypothetical protein
MPVAIARELGIDLDLYSGRKSKVSNAADSTEGASHIFLRTIAMSLRDGSDIISSG